MMGLRDELAQVVETTRRELAAAQARVETLQTGLPALEAALRVLSNGFLEGSPARTPVSQAAVLRTETYPNPFQPETHEWFAYEVLMGVGQPLHVENLAERASILAGYPVKRSSIDNRLYRHVKAGQYFRKVAAATFDIIRPS